MFVWFLMRGSGASEGECPKRCGFGGASPPTHCVLSGPPGSALAGPIPCATCTAHTPTSNPTRGADDTGRQRQAEVRLFVRCCLWPVPPPQSYKAFHEYMVSLSTNMTGEYEVIQLFLMASLLWTLLSIAPGGTLPPLS